MWLRTSYRYRWDWTVLSMIRVSGVLGLIAISVSVCSSVREHISRTTARTTSWMMSENDCLNKKRFNSRRKVPQRRQLAVYSRCVEPQPQRLGCRLLTVWRAVCLAYHEAVGIRRMQRSSTRQVVSFTRYSELYLSKVADFYRAMLCIRGTSHGPVSVRHNSEFY